MEWPTKTILCKSSPIENGCDIVGESVEVVAAAGIVRARMAAPVERHATPTARGEIDDGYIPPVRAHSPWRNKDYWPACPTIPKVEPRSIAALDHRRGAGRVNTGGLLGLRSEASPGNGRPEGPPSSSLMRIVSSSQERRPTPAAKTVTSEVMLNRDAANRMPRQMQHSIEIGR